MKKGVPQGSVLEPAIFAIFVADLKCRHPHNTQVMYADDITLIMPLYDEIKRDPESLEHTLSAEITNVKEWCTKNCLNLNEKKSSVLLCLKNTEIPEINLSIPVTYKTKILGVTINNNLTWHDHIKDISIRCHRRMFILPKSSDSQTNKV